MWQEKIVAVKPENLVKVEVESSGESDDSSSSSDDSSSDEEI